MNRDRKLGIIFMLFGAGIIFLSQQITIMNTINEPGPKLFPMIAGLGIMLSSLVMVLGRRKDEGSEDVFLSGEGWKQFGFAFFVLLLYAGALYFLGFLISTPLAVLGFIKVLKKEKQVNWIFCIVLGLIMGIGIYYMFEKIFLISLPNGIFFR